jgi:hypothetical protein
MITAKNAFNISLTKFGKSLTIQPDKVWDL